MSYDEMFCRLWLKQLPRVGNWSQHILLLRFPDAQTIFQQDFHDPLLQDLVQRPVVESLIAGHDQDFLDEIEALREECEEDHIRLLRPEELGVEERILKNAHFPILLYARGELSTLSRGLASRVCITGTRRSDRDGREMAAEVAEDLASNGNVIVSGLDKGIDAAVQQAAVDAGAPSIAVLASGIESGYPADQKMLMARIAERGLLLSEFAPRQGASKWTFPARNRLMAAISSAVRLIDPDSTPGSHSTAEFARQFGRPVTTYSSATGEVA